MSFLYRILYAAHAKGTHHKLALKAVEALEGPRANAWKAVFLAHSEQLLIGSKAPDTAFKDFQNHVLHVGDGDWGGAREAARDWYERMVDSLASSAWADAVYAAGVLSHYLSDPLMPLHTGSSEAETHVHRALEWSASKAFEEIWAIGAETRAAIPAGPEWLEAMLRDGAVAAHSGYERLIAHYDLDAGVQDPPSGLNLGSRALLAPLLRRAVAMIAAAFERAIEEADVKPPKTSQTAAAVIASLSIPVKFVAGRLQDAADRREVIRIHEELRLTGKLQLNLPEEQRAVTALAAARPPVRATDRASVAQKSALRPEDAPRLSRTDPVERAPSIGPKTAARLAVIGVRTVGDLIDADPTRVAEALGDRRFSPLVIGVWRDQASLLTRLPRLKSAQAVMLVAAGYRDVAVIAQAERAPLAEALVSASSDAEIRRATWNAAPPDAPAIERIIATARQAMAAA